MVKKKAGQTNVQELRSKYDRFKQKAEQLFAEIAERRDKLRDLVSEIEEVMDNVDTADADFEHGLRYLTDAIDKLSETL